MCKTNTTGVLIFKEKGKNFLIHSPLLLIFSYLCIRFVENGQPFLHFEVCIMCSLELTKIDLKGMKEEANRLDFDLTDDFFQALDGSQLEHGTLHVSVSIRKMAGFFELQFHTEGHVTVTCDRCLDDMEQPIETDNRLLVRLGDTYSEDDDTVTIDENEGILDASWFIYEFIMLAIPIKHVHYPSSTFMHLENAIVR